MESLSPSRRSSRSIVWRSQIGFESSAKEVATRREAFEQFTQQYPYPEDPALTLNDNNAMDEGMIQNDNSASPAAALSGSSDLDPLTAMLLQDQALAQQQQNMDLEYRKEMARRRRSKDFLQDKIVEEESYDRNLVALQIIDKDLHRLAHPSGDESSNSSHQRKEILRRVLYVYNCRHEHIGYRQGMHEIASWLLWALEQSDDDDTIEQMDASTMASECYILTESILTDIQPAYDVGEGKPMEEISKRVLDLVAKADFQVRLRLDHLGIPPTIYLTKWLRLLFSREVVNVMTLWDVLFNVKEDGFGWMMILEATAAARLLQHRSDIIRSSDDGLLHLLMNMAPEQDLQSMLQYLQPLLRGEPLDLPVIELPPAPIVAHDGPSPANGGKRDGIIGQTSPLFSTQTVGSLAAHLTGVKETIAAQTHSISKRLMQEWEAIQAENQLAQRSYDDGFWNHSLANVNANSFDGPIGTATPHHDRLQQQQGNSITTSNVLHSPTRRSNTFPPHTWAYEMEHRLGVLQNFVMLTEQRNRGSVAPAVWEALADLEEMRQSILHTQNAS